MNRKITDTLTEYKCNTAVAGRQLNRISWFKFHKLSQMMREQGKLNDILVKVTVIFIPQ